jgi:hypothetical protein
MSDGQHVPTCDSMRRARANPFTRASPLYRARAEHAPVRSRELAVCAEHAPSTPVRRAVVPSVRRSAYERLSVAVDEPFILSHPKNNDLRIRVKSHHCEKTYEHRENDHRRIYPTIVSQSPQILPAKTIGHFDCNEGTMSLRLVIAL